MLLGVMSSYDANGERLAARRRMEILHQLDALGAPAHQLQPENIAHCFNDTLRAVLHRVDQHQQQHRGEFVCSGWRPQAAAAHLRPEVVTQSVYRYVFGCNFGVVHAYRYVGRKPTNWLNIHLSDAPADTQKSGDEERSQLPAYPKKKGRESAAAYSKEPQEPQANHIRPSIFFVQASQTVTNYVGIPVNMALPSHADAGGPLRLLYCLEIANPTGFETVLRRKRHGPRKVTPFDQTSNQTK